MEALAVILTSVLGLGSSLGIITDRVVEGAIRQQVPKIEQLAVRVDNSPNYQLLLGRVDRIRLASRGVYFVPFLRIDTLELETDRIGIKTTNNKVELLEPLQAAVRVVLKEEDINRAIDSPFIRPLFQSIKVDFSGFNPSLGEEEIDIVNPRIYFLTGNKVRVTATLVNRKIDVKPLEISAEVSIEVLSNGNVKLNRVELSVAGVKIPDILIGNLVRGINQVLDLKQLEAQGIKSRVLKFEVVPGQMQLIGFAQLDRLPSN
jgi:hypothetical protein